MNFDIEKKEKIFSGKVFDIQVDTIKYNSGNSDIREIVLHNGGAVVAPLTNEGKIVFVKQFRYPFQKVLLELPAGKLDPAEDPQKCAERELTEETGYTAKSIEKLGEIYTSPGFCTEILYLYSAVNLTAGDHDREEGEFGMEVIELTFEEAEEKIAYGEIVDAKTICAFHMLKQKVKMGPL